MAITPPRRTILHDTPIAGRWQKAVKSQICGAEAVKDKDSFSVSTSWGSVLNGKRGDYLVWDEADPSDRWIVDPAVFNSSYLQFEPGRFRKTALTDVQQITEPVSVHSNEGTVDGNPGDYLARGVTGEFWVIPAAFFAKAYKITDEQNEKH